MGETRLRSGTVDDLPVAVLDGLMAPTQTAQMFQWLNGLAFTRNEVAREDTQAFRHWAWNLSVAECERLPLFAATAKAVAAHFAARGPQRCYRTYCNLSTYGDMLFTHTDSQPGAEELTALWYIAPRWDLEWGGETLLFNADGDAEFVVSPRPGRLLIFDGRIRHAGRPPSRVCVIPRLTFALKFEPQPPP
ncbi:MAG: 2OG-Fe(II) oxygenase [Bryobacteraceae bacterium]